MPVVFKMHSNLLSELITYLHDEEIRLEEEVRTSQHIIR